MLDSAQIRICVMGRYGFYAKAIARYVKNYDGLPVSTSTIYKVLKNNGISLRKYRTIETYESRAIAKLHGATDAVPKITQKLKSTKKKGS